MGIRILWTDFARQELKKIFEYHKDAASKTIAKRLVLGIERKTHMLVEHPSAGSKEELLSGRNEEFRYLVYKNYKIIYWLNPDKNQIEITDVFDCRQNPVKMNKPYR